MAHVIRDWDAWTHATREEWAAAGLARPKRPPRPDQPLPPPPPLGLARVDATASPTGEEWLPRGAAPWLRPTLVETWNGAAWVQSASALAALDKRSFYLPAGWPEELDDRTGVSGRLRVTYPAGPPFLTFPTRRVLTARATVGGEWLVDGEACEMRPLGPYAPAGKRPPRGVHPWAIVTGLISAPADPLILELDTRGSRFSQLLLALSGAP